MADHDTHDHTGIPGVGSGTTSTTVATDPIWDAAGDIVVGTGANTAARLAAGTNGEVLTLVSGTPSWEASGTPADITDIPTAETDDTLRLAPDGAGGVEWAAGGGGGLAHSFVGYNTVGGSWETMTTVRQYCKAFTLAGAGLVVSVDAYLRPSTDNFSGLAVTILADNAGAPGVLMGVGPVTLEVYLANSSSMPGAARWVSMPMGAYLPAGNYWACVMSNSNRQDLAYDGSGSDRYFTPSQFLATGAYTSAWAITTSTNRYSIRASVLA